MTLPPFFASFPLRRCQLRILSRAFASRIILKARNGVDQLPVQTGMRFSTKARGPS